jgi:hypothetical protein
MWSIIRDLKIEPDNNPAFLEPVVPSPRHPFATTAHWIDQEQEDHGNAAQSWVFNVSVHRSEQAMGVLNLIAWGVTTALLIHMVRSAVLGPDLRCFALSSHLVIDTAFVLINTLVGAG